MSELSQMSLIKRYVTVALGTLFSAGAVWRVFTALKHYHLSLEALDDPSIRELEQVSAAVEGGISLLLLAHAFALFSLSRRPLLFRWPCAVCASMLCATVVSGSLLGLPVLSIPLVYTASMVLGMAILSQLLMFSWLSLYLGALVGSGLAYYGTAPVPDALTSLFVVFPCVMLSFVGAGLGRIVSRANWNKKAF